MIKLRKLLREAIATQGLDQFTKSYIDTGLALSDSDYTYHHGDAKQAWKPGAEWEPGYRNDIDADDSPTGDEEHSGEPLSHNYGIEDIDPETMKKVIRDCKDFQAKYSEFYEAAGWTDDAAGYDFWLTQTHHGAGFWDRDSSTLFNTTLFQEKGEEGIKAVAKILTDAAHSYGGYNFYLGDGAYDGYVCGAKG